MHKIHNWEYADAAAARTGATGFIASDVGKWAKQLDDGTFWELTATTPTWEQRIYTLDQIADAVVERLLPEGSQFLITE